MLARRGEIFQTSRRLGQPFLGYLGLYANTGNPPTTLGDMTRVVRTVVDRLIQDEVDRVAYVRRGRHQAAHRAVIDIFDRYTAHLKSTNQMDFPTLEHVFLDRLKAGRIPDLVAELRVLLVDEYQDTNPLQERIYLELTRTTGAALTVVGDALAWIFRRGWLPFRNVHEVCAHQISPQASDPAEQSACQFHQDHR